MAYSASMRQLVCAASLVLAAGGWGCESDSSGGTSNLGVEGASCTSTPQCQAPLQCMALVCTNIGGGGGSDVADAEGGADTHGPSRLGDTGPELADLPVITDFGGGPDTVGLELVPSDADGGLLDKYVAPEWFSDCEELGIAPGWAGTFGGSIEFDVEDEYGILYPTEGVILVSGELSFQIECIDSKLVVLGLMTGIGKVQGRPEDEEFPYSAKLNGFYSPSTHRMTTKLVDGAVNIYGVVEVYFAGTLEGEIDHWGEFGGIWQGEATGTSVDGISGVAEGQGFWRADATN